MNNRILGSFITVLFILMSVVPSFAQAKIDKLVSKLENSPQVDVTYTERRDPKTRKMLKQSTILNGSDRKTAEALWKAFEDECQNSVSVTKTRDKSFVIKFINKDVVSSYVLSISGSWSLVISKRPMNNEDRDDYSFNNFDFSDFNDFAFEMPEFNFDSMDALNSLDALGSLEQLNNLETLGSLGQLKDLGKLGDNFSSFSGNVKVYDKNGNVIFEKSDDKADKSKSKTKSKHKSKSKSTSTSISSSNGNSQTQTITTTTVNGKTYQTISYM